jgi:hypothetical protein
MTILQSWHTWLPLTWGQGWPDRAGVAHESFAWVHGCLDRDDVVSTVGGARLDLANAYVRRCDDRVISHLVNLTIMYRKRIHAIGPRQRHKKVAARGPYSFVRQVCKHHRKTLKPNCEEQTLKMSCNKSKQRPSQKHREVPALLSSCAFRGFRFSIIFRFLFKEFAETARMH